MILGEIRELIDCPIDWYSLTCESEFGILMRGLWFTTICEHQVDHESSYLDGTTYEFSDLEAQLADDDDLAPDLANIRSWIQHAREEYLSFARRFTELRAATQDDYAKHYPLPGATAEQARKASVAGVGILAPTFDAGSQLFAGWQVLTEVASLEADFYSLGFEQLEIAQGLRAIFEAPGLKVHARMPFETGFAFGASTRFACFDYDFSTPILHVYPVSSQEFEDCDGYAVEVLD